MASKEEHRFSFSVIERPCPSDIQTEEAMVVGMQHIYIHNFLTHIMVNMKFHKTEYIKRVQRGAENALIFIDYVCNIDNIDALYKELSSQCGYITGYNILHIPKDINYSKPNYLKAKELWPINYRDIHEKDTRWSEMDLEYKSVIEKCISEVQEDPQRNISILIDPRTLTIVTKSHDKTSEQMHPLKHSSMSLIEDLSDLQKLNKRDEKEYLMTNMDVVIMDEPCVMCSMALLHSRVRRLFFINKNPTSGGIISNFNIHKEKRLNHHFSSYIMDK